MDVVEMSRHRSAEWDAFVMGETTGDIFHLWEWLSVFQEVFGFQPRYLVAEDRGGIQGVLPLFIIHQWFGGKILSSLYGGVCARMPETRIALVEKAKELAAGSCSSHLIIRDDPSALDGLSPSHVTLATSVLLPEEPSLLWGMIDPAARRAVRKAQREGLIVDRSGQYLPEFYRVYVHNMHHLGTPSLPFSYLEKILTSFPVHAELVVAKKKGRVIAGMVNFGLGGKMRNLLASSVISSRADRPMDLLYYSVLKDAAERNFSRFDLGRSQPDSGTYRFKQKWGGEDVELKTYEFKSGRQVFHATRHEKMRAISARIWRALPLRAACRLGPIVRRRLPMG